MSTDGGKKNTGKYEKCLHYKPAVTVTLLQKNICIKQQYTTLKRQTIFG